MKLPRARTRRHRWSTALALLVAAQASACIGEPPPTTLDVSSVEPREVDVGDRIEIGGAGFPVRKKARITFRGTVHRAGLPGEHVAAAVEVESRSEGRLEIPVDAALAERLAATGESGHATFRGEVTVTFPPGEAGAAPLAGKAGGVVLDVRGGRSSKPEKREEGARAALEQLGIEIGGVAAASGGLVVAAVRPGSSASGAGLLAQDVIVDFDGVRVASVADLVPAGDAVASLAVRRDGAEELRTVAIPLDGIAKRIPRTLAFSGALVGAAALLLVLSMRKPSASAALVERRIAERVRALGAHRGAEVREGWRVAWAVLAGERAYRPSLDAVVFSTGCAALATVVPTLTTDLDVISLSLAAMAGGASLSLSGGASLPVFVAYGAAALSVFTAVVTSGSFRIADLLRAQGAMPWEWLAFRTPATLASLLAWGFAAASIGRDRRRPSERAAVLVSAALIALLFFGGFRVPGARAIEHEGWALVSIGGAMYLGKSWLAWLAIDLLRGLLPIVRAKGRVLRLMVPLAVGAPLLAAATGAMPANAGVGHVSSLATFGVTAVVAAYGALRMLAAIERVGAGHLDPSA
jgi:NADH-quinone oxidoreductase subunit H